MANLRSLNLEGSLASPEGVDFIIKSSALKNLAHLNLNNCKLTDQGVLDLFKSSLILQLESLSLKNCNLTEEALPESIEAMQRIDRGSTDQKLALKFLDLRDNLIEEQVSITRIEYLCDVIVLIDDK